MGGWGAATRPPALSGTLLPSAAWKAFSNTSEARSLTGEYKRALQHTMRDYKRNGFGLSKSKRDEVRRAQRCFGQFDRQMQSDPRSSALAAQLKALNKKANDLGNQYLACLSADITRLSFSRAELAGRGLAGVVSCMLGRRMLITQSVWAPAVSCVICHSAAHNLDLTFKPPV